MPWPQGGKETTMYFAGIDIGSTMTKVVVIDEKMSVLSSVIGPTGVEHRHLAFAVMEDALEKIGVGIDQVDFIVATGYGRINVPFADRQVTEITCHARGIHWLFPSARVIIDIGGQDSKGIKLDDQGKVINFAMNDKCAAGTGRFLEVIAETLGLSLEQMGEVSLKAENPVPISNMCTVFAEHEVTSHLAEGAGVPEIVAGLHAAIAARVVNMVRHLGIRDDVVFTGGGAKNIGLIRALEEKIGLSIFTAPEPLITGALGAALSGKIFADKGVRRSSVRKQKGVTFFS